MKKYYHLISMLLLCHLANTQSNLKKLETNLEKHQNTRYIIGDTAFNLEKGEIMYQNILLGYNNFTFGVSDNFSINTGIEIFSALSQDILLLSISPKYTFNYDGLIKFGIGVNTLFGATDSDLEVKGRAYAIATIGEPYKNISLGLGYIFGENETIDFPVLQLGSTYPISENFSLIIEAYIYKDETINGIVTPNLQYHNKRHTISFGLAKLSELNGSAVPLISYSKIF